MNVLFASLLGVLLPASHAFGSDDPDRFGRAGSDSATSVQSSRPAIAATQTVPSAGTVESVSGEVLRATQSGWKPVQPGEPLEDGARIQLIRGASLTIRYPSGEVRAFKALPSQRSLTLTVNQKQ